MELDRRQSESDLTADTTSALNSQPIPPAPKWQPPVTSVFSWHQQRERQEQLEQELARTRGELEAMQALLEELPKLFEDKFRQRLQPMLEQQQRLLEENNGLRQHLHQLQPSPDAARQRLLLPRLQERPRMRQALRHAFGLEDREAA